MSYSKFQKNGFTLIEVLIASAIFVVLITTAVATFGFSSDLQEKNLAIREASQNARFVIEAIARDVRLADSFTISSDGTRIDLVKDGQDISYYFSDNNIYYDDGNGEEVLTDGTIFVVTQGDDYSYFQGIDDSNSDIQSYVKIKMVFVPNNKNAEKNIEQYKETIETTVATREYTKGYSGKVTSD